MCDAPLVVVPLANERAYLDRYAEPDKGWEDRAESRWQAPYWYVDTGIATLLMLLTAVDEGLGACFFGLPPESHEPFRREFGVPADLTPLGDVTVGYRAPEQPSLREEVAARRRPLDEVVHRGRWGGV